MFRTVCLMLALSAGLGAGPKPRGDALETIRSGSYSHATGFHARLRVLNWNIDRGKHFEGILAAMRENQPDLCFFQEVDLDARRTHARDIAQELAETFRMNYAFAPEFQELSQGSAAGLAYQGQAILTTLPVRSSRLLRFTHQSGFWKPHPLLISTLPILQRREGGRIAQVSELNNGARSLLVYNLHLESRGNEQLRLMQLEEVLADAAGHPPDTPVIIAGDFNTKSRHSPLVDRLRAAGYSSAFGDRRVRTHIFIGALDWVFVRGPIQCDDVRVIRDAHASDHFPIVLDVRFQGI